MRYFTCSAQKINSHCFTWFLILDKIQDGGQDGNHAAKMATILVTSQTSSSATTHKIYLILKRRFTLKDQRLSTEGKNRFEILQHIKNSRGVPSTAPPPPPCTMVGLWLCVYVRGLKPEGNWVEWTFAKTSGAVTRDRGEREKKWVNSQF